MSDETGFERLVRSPKYVARLALLGGILGLAPSLLWLASAGGVGGVPTSWVGVAVVLMVGAGGFCVAGAALWSMRTTHKAFPSGVTAVVLGFVVAVVNAGLAALGILGVVVSAWLDVG